MHASYTYKTCFCKCESFSCVTLRTKMLPNIWAITQWGIAMSDIHSNDLAKIHLVLRKMLTFRECINVRGW